MIVNAIPHELYSAVASGVGLFIAFIGLRNAGIVARESGDDGGAGRICTARRRCWLCSACCVTAALLCARVNAAILIGVLATWVLAAVTGTIHWQPQPYSVGDIVATAGQLDIRGALGIGLFEIVFRFSVRGFVR